MLCYTRGTTGVPKGVEGWACEAYVHRRVRGRENSSIKLLRTIPHFLQSHIHVKKNTATCEIYISLSISLVVVSPNLPPHCLP